MCRHGIGILHEGIRIVRNVLRGCVVLRHCIRVRGGDGSRYRECGTVNVDRCGSPHLTGCDLLLTSFFLCCRFSL